MIAINKNLYSIGQAAKKCRVSKKTLRFYEKLGIIHPDYIDQQNGYRYYSEETLLLIPVIKYYKQMGFKLQEMLDVQKSNSWFFHEKNFISKLEELRKEKENINNRYTAVFDWLNLLQEGKMILENQIRTVNIKYVDQINFYYQKQAFNNCYRETLINISWVNYLEENNTAITGPVYLAFPSFEDRVNNKKSSVTIMQQPVGKLSQKMNQLDYGGGMFICKYHIGDPKDICQTYAELKKWADDHDYLYGPEAFERHIVDYWTTVNPDEFVSEIMVPLKKMDEPF